MINEKRQHPRFNTEGISANIIIEPSSADQKTILQLEGVIIDMSYTGIKIKLKDPINIAIPESEIKINLTLPESGIPVSINGIIKHFDENSEFGMQYSNSTTEDSIDNLIFECVKKVKH